MEYFSRRTSLIKTLNNWIVADMQLATEASKELIKREAGLTSLPCYYNITVHNSYFKMMHVDVAKTVGIPLTIILSKIETI